MSNKIMDRIFIVEDEWIVALELQERIQDLGYEFAGTTDTGESAIRMILETKPDLILMDINIKGEMDGIEASRRILEKYNVPIIYITAYSDKATLERAKITTPYGYIIKPVEERDLHISIEISLTKFRMEKKLKESEKNLSITLQSIGDGVIATDQYSLITRMNRTAEKMCGWTLQEALGLPLNRVFNIVCATTRQPLENPVEEVLKTGGIVELANHTILISRDGTERHISDSAAPIRDDSNEIQGIVLVFSDVSESYRNRARLQQSEKLYREVIENATDIIYSTDQKGKFIHANASALKLTGYSKEEIESRNFFELIAPEYRNKTKVHYYRQFLENVSSTYAEVPVIKKNGELCWFGQNVTLVKGDDNVAGFQVIARDVSDRKKAEDALRKSEEMLRLIIDIIPDRIFVKDTEGKFIVNNRAHLKALGARSQEEALGKTDFDFRSKEKAQLYQNQDIQVLETKQPLMEYQQHEFKEDGSEAWLLVSKLPFTAGDGEIIGIVGISRDITSQKEAEDTIRESERRFQTLANVSPVGIFSTDATGYTTYVNPRWCEISGMSAEEALGDGWLSAVHEDDKTRLNQEWHSASLAKRPSRADYRFTKQDGSVAWVMGHAVPELDENNEIVGYVGTITDITNRKIIEDALKESENIFNQFMMHSPIYIFFKDHNGRPVRLSNNFEQLVGLPIEEMIGKTMFELFPSDFAKAMVEDDLKVLREGLQIQIEESLNGRHYTTIKFPIQHDGKPPLLAGYTIDITERKNNELEIKRLANALKSINECVSITDLDNRLTFVNESFLQTYGYSEQELLGQEIKLIGSSQIPAELTNEIRESTLQGGWKGELINKKKDGTEFPIHLSTKAIYDKQNNPIAMIGVASDITIRKQYEAEIIKLNQAVIQSPVSLLITDLNGKIEYINPKVSEKSGYSAEELIGNSPTVFNAEELPEEQYKLMWETISSGKEWRGEFKNRKKNGELFWEYSSISPIRNKQGIITNYMALNEDITERKKLELGLIQAKEKAEAASELKDAFIANISHEIRTPLNGILGMTSIIKEVFADHIGTQEEQYFTAIERSSRRIIRTVDMILNFSRLQVGDFKSSTRVVCLDNLLNGVYLEFALAAKQKGLLLAYERRIEQTEIKSDSYCLTQVLSNLLDNALKYTNDGTIKIILYRDSANNLKIDIEDTGIGISEAYMNQLFQPYSQEEVGYTRTYEGVGLGLSLVKNFLKLVNADISVKSQKGVGTTFTINFGDLKTESNTNMPTESVESPRAEINQDRSGTKHSAVLVVEDEKINQMFLSIKLKHSFDVKIVANASKALAALEEKRFDVILMDISLKGGLNGIELTQILKASSEYKNIPIIAVTGHAFSQDKEKCLAAGCDDYISKPFKIEELERKIHQLAGAK